MAFPLDYWREYQEPVTSISEFLEIVSALAETWPERTFVWRGCTNSAWSLHSSLYRRASKKEGRRIRERMPYAGGRAFRDYEHEIFDQAREWGLAFTLRVPAAAKPALRRDLERGFGYSHAMLYPDFPGFAAFGRSIPRVPD